MESLCFPLSPAGVLDQIHVNGEDDEKKIFLHLLQFLIDSFSGNDCSKVFHLHIFSEKPFSACPVSYLLQNRLNDQFHKAHRCFRAHNESTMRLRRQKRGYQ